MSWIPFPTSSVLPGRRRAVAENCGCIRTVAASRVAQENHRGAPENSEVQAPPRHVGSKAFGSVLAALTGFGLRALGTKQPDALPAGSVAEAGG